MYSEKYKTLIKVKDEGYLSGLVDYVSYSFFEFRLGHDLRVVRLSPAAGSVLGMESAYDSLPLPIPPLLLTLCKKTKQNPKPKPKTKQNKKTKKLSVTQRNGRTVHRENK